MEVKLSKKEYEELVSYKEKYEDFKEYSHTFLLNGKNWEVCGNEIVVKKIQKEIKPLIEMHARLAVAEDKLSETKQLLDDTLELSKELKKELDRSEKTLKERSESSVINDTRVKERHDREVSRTIDMWEKHYKLLEEKYKQVSEYNLWEFFKYKGEMKKFDFIDRYNIY